MIWRRLLYNLAFPAFFIILLPSCLIRLIERGKFRHKFGQRFACYSSTVRTRLARLQPWTWIHAVSVGEVLIAFKLIRCMEQKDPACHFILSTTTTTGFTLAEREKNENTEVIYNPIDFCMIVRRAVCLIKPRQLILIESEVWPNLIWEAKKFGASVALINARISHSSAKRYRLFRFIFEPILHMFDVICVQHPSDVLQWKKLGVRSTQVYLTGSVKFDDTRVVSRPLKDLQPLLLSIGCKEDALVLLGVSTHSGEEKMLGRVFLSIHQAIPNTFLLVAPRHIERVKEVLKDLMNCGLRPALRSQQTSLNKINCLVLDSIGELQDWYSCVHAVFVGKSLTAYGGQNPAEAIAAGKPVTFGPHMGNFHTLTQELLLEGGAIVSHNERELQENLLRMLTDSVWAETLCKSAMRCMRRHHGATERTRKILCAIQPYC